MNGIQQLVNHKCTECENIFTAFEKWHKNLAIHDNGLYAGSS